MNRKRIFAIGKLVVLFGTPVALILGLFSGGVYCGVQNRGSIARFERDWLGLDVQVPDSSEEGPAEGEAAEGEAAKGEAAEGEAAEGEAAEGKAAEGEVAEGKAAEGKTAEGEAAEGKAAEGPAAEGSAPTPAPATPPVVSPTPSGQPGGVPAPLPAPEARVDPLDEEHADRLAVPVVVRVKVLVDPPLIEQRADWIDYVQRTVSEASHIYEQQFGLRLELVSVGRWLVPPEGMGADALLRDLQGHSREGADLLVGLTNRPFDGTTSGRADTPAPDSPFNGAYGVVYATPGHRRAHLRTLLHEVAHMFGAKDIDDPEHPGWKAGSWMSYAVVSEAQAPWIDPANRERVLERKDRPFAPEPPEPSEPSAPAEPAQP